jgi:hypothetical protein
VYPQDFYQIPPGALGNRHYGGGALQEQLQLALKLPVVPKQVRQFQGSQVIHDPNHLAPRQHRSYQTGGKKQIEALPEPPLHWQGPPEALPPEGKQPVWQAHPGDRRETSEGSSRRLSPPALPHNQVIVRFRIAPHEWVHQWRHIAAHASVAEQWDSIDPDDHVHSLPRHPNRQPVGPSGAIPNSRAQSGLPDPSNEKNDIFMSDNPPEQQ